MLSAFSWQVLAGVQDLLCESPVPTLAVLKALLAMMPIMISGDGTYIFNQLYIEPPSPSPCCLGAVSAFFVFRVLGKSLQQVVLLVFQVFLSASKIMILTPMMTPRHQAHLQVAKTVMIGVVRLTTVKPPTRMLGQL